MIWDRTPTPPPLKDFIVFLGLFLVGGLTCHPYAPWKELNSLKPARGNYKNFPKFYWTYKYESKYFIFFFSNFLLLYIIPKSFSLYPSPSLMHSLSLYLSIYLSISFSFLLNLPTLTLLFLPHLFSPWFFDFLTLLFLI